MSTDRDATRRRHVREKSVIDHVARDLFKPQSEPDATGNSIEKSPLENESETQGALDPEGSLAVIATRKRPA